jgi:hypothetical protein
VGGKTLTNGGDGGDDLTELQLVENGRFSGGIEPDLGSQLYSVCEIAHWAEKRTMSIPLDDDDYEKKSGDMG